jgi:hypothetical protein
MENNTLNNNDKLIIEKFEKKHKEHIDLVKKYAKKLVKTFTSFSELIVFVEVHDQDKINNLVLKRNFAISSFINECKINGISIDTKTYEEDIKSSIFLHQSTSYHHPEFWDINYKEENIVYFNENKKNNYIVDAELMDDISIAEMVCDWMAKSEETKKNIDEFIKENINIRWKFSDHQLYLIKSFVYCLKQ